MQLPEFLPHLQEQSRLAKLYSYNILRTAPEEEYDDIARLAAQICGTPVAFVGFIDEHSQWLKARCGTDFVDIPRTASFCQYTIEQDDVIVVEDTSRDPRFHALPFVAGEPGIRFYAGAPLITPDGHHIGSVCVLDFLPRSLSREQAASLGRLGGMVVQNLELRRLAAERALLNEEHERAARELKGSEHNLRLIADNVPGLLARVDRDYRYRFANRAYDVMLGVNHLTMLGRTMAEVIGIEAFASVKHYVDRALSGANVVYDTEIVFATVGRRWIQVSYVPDYAESGEVLGFFLSVIDITQRKQAEIALRERTELLDNVLSTAPLAVYWKDKDSTYLGCNASFAQMAEIDSPAMIFGKSDYDLPWPIEDAEQYRKEDEKVVASGRPLLNIEEKYVGSDGSPAIALTSKLPLHDADGNIFGVLGVSTDVTERKALELEREALLERTKLLLSEALKRADQDSLTETLNHRAFHKELQEEITRAQRGGDTLAVAVLDLDHFNYFNDVYGYVTGDGMLRYVAELIQRQCRPDDTLARFGGDEFALLLPHVSPTDAEAITRRIVETVEKAGFVPPGHNAAIPLGICAGMALYPLDSGTRLGLLATASERLRLAKSGGDSVMALAQSVRRDLTRSRQGFPMLDAMTAAVDNKDRYTRRHSEDVLSYSLDIAVQLGLSLEEQDSIKVAALLHDIGKIGVPDHILRKPGTLTQDEFEAVKQHPLMGAIIVAAVPGFEETLDAVRHHHERWDGEGYPFGLKGEEIPLPARIMAVADAFSAMTTDRPYRQGMSEEQACAIIRRGAGSQWNPECVEAFLRSRGCRSEYEIAA